MLDVLVFVVTAIASLGLGEMARWFAVRRNVIDVPNDRSSHRVPTPRGGGVAIALVSIAGVALLGLSGSVPGWIVLGFCVPGAAIAMVGLLDDVMQLAASTRLVVHVVACAGGLLALPALEFAGLRVGLLPVALLAPLMLLVLVWSVNLYNFMDGIDGIAGMEAVFAGLMIAILSHRIAGPASGLPAVALAGAAGGFLVLNWPPARIFMGDSGSAFLGYALCFLGLALSHAGVNLWALLIVVGAFVSDATVTLVRRLLRREDILKPHRSHAYQRLTDRFGGHLPVTRLYGMVNVFWLAPLALVAQEWPDWAGLIAVLAYLPLVSGVALMGSNAAVGVNPQR